MSSQAGRRVSRNHKFLRLIMALFPGVGGSAPMASGKLNLHEALDPLHKKLSSTAESRCQPCPPGEEEREEGALEETTVTKTLPTVN